MQFRGSITHGYLAGVSGQSLNTSFVTSTTYNIPDTDCVLFVAPTSNTTLYLPASSKGKVLYIKKINTGGGSMTIRTTYGGKIDTGNTATIASNTKGTWTLVCDGVDWWIF
jgi:hypothetical protein